MQRINGQFVFSASDLNNFLECRRLTELEEQVALGKLTAPKDDDEAALLLRRKGDEHERAYLARLRASHAVVSFDRASPGIEAYHEAEAATLRAMQAGARYIHQATFFDGTFVGHADFLRRVEVPSKLGSWSYEVIDTKLALSSKAYFLVQLCNYSEHLERLTGVAPRAGHIVLGNGREESYDVNQYSAYYRHVKAAFLARVAERKNNEYPYKRAHCQVCPWNASCRKQRVNDDHLSLVAWMRRDQVAKFEASEITTVHALSAAADDARPTSMNETTFAKLRRQAKMQVRGRTEGPVYQIIEHDPKVGFGILPEPNDGDVFFDMEGDPHYEPGAGLEYLFGAWTLDKDEPFRTFWGLNRPDEKSALEAFVDFIMERRRLYPAMHVYHYASYEKTALRKLSQRHNTREIEIDELLRGEVLVDLFAVVRQSLVISEDSYSIKRLEKFYGLKRETEVLKGDESILLFERWMQSGDRELLQKIEDYNRDDCLSTLLLRNWLLERRSESAEILGSVPPFRPLKDGAAKDPADPAEEARRSELERELLAGAESERTRYLLASALGYHRREEKPVWWALFDRIENPDQLLEFDREALAGLRFAPEFEPRPLARSMVYTYRYPEQQHKVSEGSGYVDPLDRVTVGEVISVDREVRTVEIKTTTPIDVASTLTALVPGGPLRTAAQRLAIARVATAFTKGELERDYPAIADLLAARSRFTHAASLTETVSSLDGSYLFIQGPPGTGKTTKSAAVICDLLAAGKRIGIVSTGHKPVQHLVRMVEQGMFARGLSFRGLYKHTSARSTYHSPLEAPMVTSTDSNKAFAGATYDLAAGTLWLLSREFDQPFDYLFIDEAGQVSLPDAIAAATSARNVVLLGDPAQLAQVSQGNHPVGTDVSVLEHLLGDVRTVGPSAGVLLDVSYRMHPEVCTFISEMMYDGRLHAGPETIYHRIESEGLSGAGLRFIPVEHAHNSASSVEEADAIVHAIRELMRGGCVDDDNIVRKMEAKNIIIVTPYNAQRVLIEQKLREAGLETAVGTVDKFQGQQAAVVFYSMATSSGDDVPRDLGFLFEQNRLNVAVSRARAMSVVVCSPRLLDVACHTPEQMALVNFLCAYVEKSTLPGRPGFSAAASASAALLSG
jgi:predicted RecB family nuclease